jgi:hypothetical protein
MTMDLSLSLPQLGLLGTPDDVALVAAGAERRCRRPVPGASPARRRGRERPARALARRSGRVPRRGAGRSVVALRPETRAAAHPPLYFAGYTDRALRRIARYGDGWLPGGLPLPVVAHMWRRLREITEAAGRDPDGQRLVVRGNATVTAEPDGQPFVGSVRQIADEVVACAAVGAHEVHLDLQFTPKISSGRQYLETAAEVLELTRGRLDRTAPVPAA